MNYQVINTNRIPFVYAYASLKFQDEFKRIYVIEYVQPRGEEYFGLVEADTINGVNHEPTLVAYYSVLEHAVFGVEWRSKELIKEGWNVL